MEQKKRNTSKEKGGRYEREVARDLSLWIFNQEHLLKREPTSGAQKNSYTGDVFPYGAIPWTRWPLHIETKNGYSEDLPTFLNYNTVLKWFIKAINESIQHNQDTIMLICQFKYQRTPILITNKLIPNIHFQLAFPCIINDQTIYGYVYKYKELLSKEFKDCFQIENI